MKRIVCAANKFPKGEIIIGVRHWDKFMCQQADLRGVKGGDEVQGFIDQHGLFYTREEAMDLVKQNGQPFNPERNNHKQTIDQCIELYSEGLY